MNLQIRFLLLLTVLSLIVFSSLLYSEKLDYKIKYLGLSVIDISYNNETEDSLIVIEAKSTGIAGTLYDVDNVYKIRYRDALLPVTYRKIISENGYTEDRLIEFNRETETARRTDHKTGEEINYRIFADSRDFFSSLMHLRHLNTDSGRFMVDAAGKNWQVNFRIMHKEKVKSCLGKKMTCKYELSFKPVDDKKKEKSDLLTSNIVNHKRYLYFWFTDDENRIPVKAKFTAEPFAVSWILKDYKN